MCPAKCSHIINSFKAGYNRGFMIKNILDKLTSNIVPVPLLSPENCSICKLMNKCISHEITVNKEFEEIINNKRPLEVKESLFTVDDTCKSIYIVKAGSFRSYITNTEGLDQTVRFYFPGDLIGLDAFSHNHLCTTTVDALETSAVCELPLPKLLILCARYPLIFSELLHMLSDEIIADHHHMILLGQTSSVIKLSIFLMLISVKYGELGYSANEFILNMGREGVGNYLRMNAQTISRAFTKLSDDNIIDVKGRSIIIKNQAKLKEIVKSCSFI